MRRLAAIVALDVVGYSRLMAEDEEGTLEDWMDLRRRLDPLFESGEGRIVKSTGDGLLIESSSVVGATRSAIQAQALVEEWNRSRPPGKEILLRIGLNLGDVIVDESGDIYGDGVNVAARLEGLAEPGGICMSDAAYSQVRGRIDASFDDRGQQWVKNIPTPIRVWAISRGDGSGVPNVQLGIAGLEQPLVIGRGGNATVYRAYQATMDRWVAVKVVEGSDEATRRRFDRERQAMGRLSQHPGIVTIYESGYTANGRPYLVMPHLAAGSLQDRLDQEGSVPWVEATSLVLAVVPAIDEAHRQGILHRDLKPANIMIDGAGRPLVADFGLASLGDRSQTAADYVALTPAYSPPELLDNAEPTPSSDVYGLAATLCALITGRPPFTTGTPDGDRLMALYRRIAVDPPPDLRPHGVPEHLCLAIANALAKSPADRPSSAGEFGASLAGEDLAHRQGETAPMVAFDRSRSAGESPLEADAATGPSRLLRLAPLIIVVGVLGAAATIFGLTNSPSTTTTTPAATSLVSTSAPQVPATAVWSLDFAADVSGVAVDGSSVFVSIADGTIHGVNAATGDPLWDEPLDLGGPVVDLITHDGHLFFAQDRSRLVYAIEIPSGVEVWRALVDLDAAEDRPQLTVSGDMVVVGLGTGVTSLEVSSGDVRWLAPMVTRLLVDSITAAGGLIATGDGRWIYGLDDTSGNTLWEIGPPQVTGGASWTAIQHVEQESGFGSSFDRRVVAITGEQELLVLDGETGAIRWAAPVSGHPALGPEALYVAGVDGELVAMDSQDGSVLWINKDVTLTQSPTIGGASIYVVSNSDLVAVNSRSGTEVGKAPLQASPTLGWHIVGETAVMVSGKTLFAVTLPA